MIIVYLRVIDYSCLISTKNVVLLYRIDTSERIDFNKSSRSKECMLCHYWYFLGTGYRYELEVCNECHDISMMAYEPKDIAMLNIIKHRLSVYYMEHE